MTVKTLAQKVADTIGYTLALAKYKGEWHYVAHMPGCEPKNMIYFCSNGLDSNLDVIGYDACYHDGEVHRIDECDECYILPLVADSFDKGIISPSKSE